MDKSYFRISRKNRSQIVGVCFERGRTGNRGVGTARRPRVDLLEKLNDPENFLDNQNLWSDFPVEEGWEKIQARLEKKRTFFYGIRVGENMQLFF